MPFSFSLTYKQTKTNKQRTKNTIGEKMKKETKESQGFICFAPDQDKSIQIFSLSSNFN